MDPRSSAEAEDAGAVARLPAAERSLRQPPDTEFLPATWLRRMYEVSPGLTIAIGDD